MFPTKCIVVLSTIILYLNFGKSDAESNGNVHLLKGQISKAMENCGETSDARSSARDEYNRRTSGSTTSKRYRRDREQNYDGYSKYEEEKTLGDSESGGDWDYEDGNRNRGKSWNNPKDDKFVIDSVYFHDRRNDSRYGGNDFRSIQDQNTTKSGQRYSENNFDSRGGRFVPQQSVRNFSFGSSVPYPMSGISRLKRDSGFVKTANDNECLSQCIFTNLQIVDDRGIPKEPLFIKLVEDTVPSQQTKSLIEKQVQACFRELQTESEDNGCSYSNALERCMDLQLKKRRDMANEQTQ